MSILSKISVDIDRLDNVALPENQAERDIAADMHDNGDFFKTSYRIAMKIKRALRTKGMTQAQLADIMGADRAMICRYLSGKANMELKTMIKIENALSINIIDRAISQKPKTEVIILKNVYADAQRVTNPYTEHYIKPQRGKATEYFADSAYCMNGGFYKMAVDNNAYVAEPITTYK